MRQSRPVFSTALTAALLGLTAPIGGAAQMVQPLPSANDPVDRLGRYIRILAASPRNLDALLGAGQAALDVGDPNAALGFFARAEDVSPGNGRVKAGLGASLVMIERPDDALRLFAEAVALGVPEAAVARDRGLAYDLRGDPRRAQRDYALAASRGGGDDELMRRHALSLGISGDRAGALAMLDPLLRRQDQGAWRARAFILAMTGDVSGANGVARQLMVPAMASAMAPLLGRLASLNAAERAHAVNFGTVPSNGTQLAVRTGDPFLGTIPSSTARTFTPPPPVTTGSELIPAGEPFGRRPTTVPATRVAQASVPVAQPGFSADRPPSSRLGQRVGARVGPVDLTRLPPEARGLSTGVTRVTGINVLPPPEGVRPTVAPTPVPRPAQIAQAQPQSQLPLPLPAPVPVPSLSTTVGPPAAATSDAAPSGAAVPTAFEVPASTPLPQAPAIEPVASLASVPTPAVSSSPPGRAPAARLSGLLDGIERETETTATLPTEREVRAARAAARKKAADAAAATAAEATAKKEREERAAAAKRNPARIWVQVATGSNDAGLALTWRRIRDANAATLKGQSGWSAPFRATNRLLAGPLPSAAAARTLVNALAKNGVQTTIWSSEAGDSVERIAAR